MASQKLIVIVGITGNQGASVADEFVDDPDWKVRGISRDPQKSSSKEWTDKGVEMVAGNLDDEGSLVAAFKGANVIFGVTDFWQGFWNPEFKKIAAETGRSINLLCYDLEVRHGKMIVDAANSTIDTLDLLVLSTVNSSTQWSKGQMKTNYHFDSKWQAVEHIKGKYPDLWKKTSLYQPSVYLTNWKLGVMVPKKQEDGTYILRLPIRVDSKILMIDASVDSGKCVKALIKVAPGVNLAGVSSVITWTEWAEIWRKHLGVKCTYEEIGDDVLPKMIPGGVGQELSDMFRYQDVWGYYGGDKTLTWPKDLGIENSLLTAEQYIKQEDWSEVLKQ